MQEHTNIRTHIERHRDQPHQGHVCADSGLWITRRMEKGDQGDFTLSTPFLPPISFPVEQQKGGNNVGVDGDCHGRAIRSPVGEMTNNV